MAKKERLAKFIDYFAMEALREGLSQHLANITPHNLLGFNKLITNLQYAMG